MLEKLHAELAIACLIAFLTGCDTAQRLRQTQAMLTIADRCDRDYCNVGKPTQ